MLLLFHQNSTIISIQVEGNSLNPDTYVELFDFDASMLLDNLGNAGPTYYFTNTSEGTAPILWRGNNYYPMPLEMTGANSTGDGTAPARPNIAVSNVNKFLLAAILTCGNLVGMKVRRWRTFYKFTDNGSIPSINMHYPIEEYTVIRKVAQSKNGIQFELASPLDRPGMKLPREQVLQDSGFPGVSRLRMR